MLTQRLETASGLTTSAGPGAAGLPRRRLRGLVMVLAFSAAARAGPAIADEVRPETVMVPMRDGVRLKTLVYHPPGPEPKRPVLLLRIPYNQPHFAAQAQRLAGAGYVAAMQ